jgi:catechol 2,3-dioxygenase-like lactoylglutathione lyase family enzyme
MATVSVRYIVTNMDEAVAFYVDELGFEVVMRPAPAFTMLVRGDLRLGGGPGGGAAMADGTMPAPGGWNRFVVEVDDIDAVAERMRGHGVRFRNEVIDGIGGRQTIVEDPAGNPVELFQPTLPEARLGSS